MPGAQSSEQVQRAGKQRQLMLARDVVVSVACGQFHNTIARQLRHHMRQRFEQTQADHIGRLGVAGPRRAHVHASILNATHDLAGGIKQGAVPIKNDQVKNLLGLVEQETYVVHVEKITSLESLKDCRPVAIDETTFEVDLSKKNKLNDFISRLSPLGMIVTDIRPKGNRLEKLFLSILKEN